MKKAQTTLVNRGGARSRWLAKGATDANEQAIRELSTVRIGRGTVTQFPTRLKFPYSGLFRQPAVVVLPFTF